MRCNQSIIGVLDNENIIAYNVKFENESKKPTNLKFEYDGKTFNSLTELQDQIIGTINSNDNEKIKTITINTSLIDPRGSIQSSLLFFIISV